MDFTIHELVKLMNWLKKIWCWLLVETNQKALAVLFALIAGAWAAYLHFSSSSENSKAKQETRTTITASGNSHVNTGSQTAAASNGGIAVNTTGNVTVGITLDEYEARLKRREQEVRKELAQAGAADKEKLALLNKQLADLQAKLQHPETALAETKQKLTEAYKAIDDIKQEVLPEQIKQAQTALIQGETSEAETLFKQVLSRGKDNAAEAAYQLAELAKDRIEYVAAYHYYQEAVSLQPDNAIYLNKTGIIAYTLGKYAEAEPLYQRSLVIGGKAFGKNHPDVAISLNNLALLYKTQSKYAEAKPLYQRSLAIMEMNLGKDHPDVAVSLNNLAELCRSQAKYAEAEILYQRSLAIDEKALDKDHPAVARDLNNLALLYETQGKYTEAEPLYQHSLEIWEKTLGKNHPDVATSLNNLAGLYRIQGKYAEAETLYQRSLAVDENALGKEHPDVARDLNNLAGLYHSQGHYAEAKPLYRRSLAILEKSFGKEHPNTKTVSDNLKQLQARLKGGLIQVRVKAILPNSQAEQLGLQANDILLRYNQKSILGTSAFIYRRSLEPVTQAATELTVLRKGKELVFKVKPGKIGAELEEIDVKPSTK